MTTLREFTERAARDGAVLWEQQDYHLAPMYAAIDGEGNEIVFDAPPLPKHISVMMVKLLLAKLEATRVVFIDEAWTLMKACTEEEARATSERMGEQSVRGEPGSKEVIIVMGEDESEPMVWLQAEIIRGEQETTLGPWVDVSPNYDVKTGLMVGMLPQRGTRQ